MSRNDTDVEEMSVERVSGPEPEKGPGEGNGPLDPNVVDFDGPDDPENPLNWSTIRKTLSIVTVSLTALLS